MTRQEQIRVNNAARAKDESYKSPVRGRFNATERAIRRLRRVGYTEMHTAEEYALALANEISNIINDCYR